MNKTISINIGGMVFNIEEKAYAILQNYIQSLERHFSRDEGKEEIIADIEARIAEMFHEKLNGNLQMAITPTEINSTIAVMGMPEDFEDSGLDFSDDESYSSTNNTAYEGGTIKKRFFRNVDDKVFGGVCSGISAFFGVENPLWLRLALIILVLFSYGFVIPIYIILWFVIPPALTTSDKLGMVGENANVSNIERKVKESLDGIADSMDEYTKSQAGTKVQNFISRTVDFSIDILGRLGLFLMAALKVLAVAMGLLLVFALGASLVALLTGGLTALPFLNNVIVKSPWMLTLGGISLFLMIGIPFVIIAYLILGLLLKVSVKNSWQIAGILGFLWLVSVAMFSIPAAKTGMEFREDGRNEEVITLDETSSDVLHLKIGNEHYFEDIEDSRYGTFNFDNEMVTYDDNSILVNHVSLDLEKSETNNFELVKESESRGRTNRHARTLAANVKYFYEQDDTIMKLEPFFSVPKEDKFRGQDLEIALRIPVGKSVFIHKEVQSILDDAKTDTRIRTRKMIGNTWTMLPEGILTCIDCPERNDPDWKVNNKKAISSTDDFYDYRDEDASDIDVSSFNELDIHGAFTINIIKADFHSCVLAGENDLKDEVEINSNNGVLSIQDERKLNFTNFWKRKKDGSMILEIKTPNLEDIDLSGANKVIVSGFDEEQMDVSISGANEIDLFSNVNQLNIEVSGASDIELNGEGTVLDVDFSGAGELDAGNFYANEVYADLSGATTAKVYAEELLDADLSGACNLTYRGDPNEIRQDVSGMGSLKREN